MSKKVKRKNKIRTDEHVEFRFETFFVNGRQKRRKVRLIDGIPADEFIEKNADEIFLAQEGYFETLHARETEH